MDYLDRLEHAVKNPPPTIDCRVPLGADVLVARRRGGGDLSFMQLFHHQMTKDLRYVDFQFPAVPSKLNIAFRVRHDDLNYRGKPIHFRVPKESHLYGTLGADAVTPGQLAGMDMAVIYTANALYPFIVCREFVLMEGLRTDTECIPGPPDA